MKTVKRGCDIPFCPKSYKPYNNQNALGHNGLLNAPAGTVGDKHLIEVMELIYILSALHSLTVLCELSLCFAFVIKKKNSHLTDTKKYFDHLSTCMLVL